IIVLVKPYIRPHTYDVSALDDAQVVDELRCGDGSKCARRVDVRQRDIIRAAVLEVVRQNIGEAGIRFALREQGNEAREPGGELVHYPWRKQEPGADGEALRE